MRILITRPEREAAALAQVLATRGHQAVIAPLFRLQVLHPPDDFAATLAACHCPSTRKSMWTFGKVAGDVEAYALGAVIKSSVTRANISFF